jgi:CRP/FNR family transcriptional regulator, cyclic AMP receptor protein
MGFGGKFTRVESRYIFTRRVSVDHADDMRLQKTSIIRVLHDEPGFSEIFISHLLARTIRVEEDLVDQLFDSSEKRLARLLFLLANFGKEGRPEPIIAKISQERLAEMIGTTRTRELLHEQISGVGLR